jgi:hypothetical protein
MEKNYWTKDEMDIIQKHYPYMEVKHLQTMLPGRSLRAIYAKANQLGISVRSHTASFMDYLRANLGRKTYTQMADELGCTKSCIAYRTRCLRPVL